MSHSDDQGLVLPPAIAPIHLVVVPIFKSEDELSEIMQTLQPQLDQLTEIKIFLVRFHFLSRSKLMTILKNLQDENSMNESLRESL